MDQVLSILPDFIENNWNSIKAFQMEFSLLITAIVLVFLDLFKIETLYKQVILIVSSFIPVIIYLNTSPTELNTFFNGHLMQNETIGPFYMIVAIFLISNLFIWLKSPNLIQLSLLFIILSSSLFLVHSNTIVSFFISLETISICSYILITLSEKKESGESGLKYLVFGATSTGVMLFGASLIYILSGSLDYSFLLIPPSVGVQIAFILFLAGLFFKTSMFPFHIWVPDVFQGGGSNVLFTINTIPKIASLILLYVLFDKFRLENAVILNYFIVISIVVTTLIGNFSALKQSDLKRLLGYSTIAQASILFLCILKNNDSTFEALLFYCFAYIFMLAPIFYFIQRFENENVNYKSLSSLFFKEPIAIISVGVSLLSLAGFPLTSGFFGKLLIFTSFYDTIMIKQNGMDMIVLITAIGSTLLGFYYYIRPIYYFVFKKSEQTNHFNWSFVNNLVIVLLSLPNLILFIKPDLLISLIHQLT